MISSKAFCAILQFCIFLVIFDEAFGQTPFPMSYQEYEEFDSELKDISLNENNDITQRKIAEFIDKWFERLIPLVSAAYENQEEELIKFNALNALLKIASYYDSLAMAPPNPLKQYEHVFRSKDLVTDRRFNTTIFNIFDFLVPLEDESVTFLINETNNVDHSEYVLGNIYGVLIREMFHSEYVTDYLIESLSTDDESKKRPILMFLHLFGKPSPKFLHSLEKELESNDSLTLYNVTSFFKDFSVEYGLSDDQIEKLLLCFYRKEYNTTAQHIIIYALTCREEYSSHPLVTEFLIDVLEDEEIDLKVKQSARFGLRRFPLTDEMKQALKDERKRRDTSKKQN